MSTKEYSSNDYCSGGRRHYKFVIFNSSECEAVVTDAIQCQLSVNSYPPRLGGNISRGGQTDFKWEMVGGRVVNCRWCVVSSSGAGVLLDFRWGHSDGGVSECAWAVAGCNGPQPGND